MHFEFEFIWRLRLSCSIFFFKLTNKQTKKKDVWWPFTSSFFLPIYCFFILYLPSPVFTNFNLDYMNHRVFLLMLQGLFHTCSLSTIISHMFYTNRGCVFIYKRNQASKTSKKRVRELVRDYGCFESKIVLALPKKWSILCKISNITFTLITNSHDIY